MTGVSAVGIVGLGVMGGGVARALSARGVEVRGYSPDPAEARAAAEAGAVAVVCGDVAESARDVDWWIVATPLSALPEVFRRGAASRPPRVMDLASLQGPPRRAAEAAGLGAVHCSAHPMAGSERSGFAASVPDLYRGAPVWLSAGEEARRALGSEAEAFWTSLEAAPRWIEAGAHDDRMAAVSHLPQVTANALAAVLASRGVDPDDLGPGGADMTRLAASSPAMWQDLLAASGPRIAPLLRELARGLEEWAERIESGGPEAVEAEMSRTRAWRRA